MKQKKKNFCFHLATHRKKNIHTKINMNNQSSEVDIKLPLGGKNFENSHEECLLERIPRSAKMTACDICNIEIREEERIT